MAGKALKRGLKAAGSTVKSQGLSLSANQMFKHMNPWKMSIVGTSPRIFHVQYIFISWSFERKMTLIMIDIHVSMNLILLINIARF